MGKQDRRYDDRYQSRDDYREHDSHHRQSPPPLPRRDNPRHSDKPDKRHHRRHRSPDKRPRSPPPLRPQRSSPPRDASPRRRSSTQSWHTPSKRPRSPEVRRNDSKLRGSSPEVRRNDSKLRGSSPEGRRHDSKPRMSSPEGRRHDSKLRGSSSVRDRPQQPVLMTAGLRRQVASYEVSDALASHRIVNHCTAIKHAATPTALPPLATVSLLESALARAEAVMNGQQAVHDRSAAFERCMRALEKVPEGLTLLKSERGDFAVPQCMLHDVVG